MSITLRLITLHEGKCALPYQDTKGIWTVGVGHNMEANGMPGAIMQALAARVGDNVASIDVPFPTCKLLIEQAGGLVDAEIDALLQRDIQADCSWLWTKPWWAQVDEARQAAANDLAFNLGQHVAQEFTTFWGLYAVGDWIAAADDLGANPRLVAEEPKRIASLQKILRTGSVAGILPEAP